MNQSRRCYVAYNEAYRCFKQNGDDKEAEACVRLAKTYRSICPSEWIDAWEEQREAGTWFGKY